MSVESTVVIGYVHPNQGFLLEKMSLSMAQQCANMGKRVVGILSVTSPWQTVSRNNLIGLALDMDPRPDWLLWWDTDMELPPRALRDLIDSAEEYGAKAATVFGLMQRHGHRATQPWTPVPNAYWKTSGRHYYIRDVLPSYTEPFWIDATGLGFTLISLDVFENYPEEHLPYHLVSEEEGAMGHDIRFFHHAGVPVLYCPQIRSLHWKLMPLDFDLYLRANGIVDEAQAIEYSKMPVMPPEELSD